MTITMKVAGKAIDGALSRRNLLLTGILWPQLQRCCPEPHSPSRATQPLGTSSCKAWNSPTTASPWGNLYTPPGFDRGRKYPAIASIHPGGGVKEQTAGLYAERLAAEGFVTLAFDASHQGASGGLPRYLDDPMRRVAISTAPSTI